MQCMIRKWLLIWSNVCSQINKNELAKRDMSRAQTGNPFPYVIWRQIWMCTYISKSNIHVLTKYLSPNSWQHTNMISTLPKPYKRALIMLIINLYALFFRQHRQSNVILHYFRLFICMVTLSKLMHCIMAGLHFGQLMQQVYLYQYLIHIHIHI